jgi:rhodanese-related sulfurtransferase
MLLFTKKNVNAIKVNEMDSILGKISLIDIREPYEYSYGHIPTAKNIPMNILLNNAGKFLEKDKEYYIVCQSGARSSAACDYLTKEGYKVINVVGGTGGYRGKLD